VLVTGVDSSLAAEMIGAYLENHPEVHTIIGTGLADTEGAGLAVEALEKSEDYLVVGFDLSPNILRLVKNGIVAYTIDQQPYVQGFFPVVQLVHLYRYGIQPMNIDAGATVIGRENVGSIIRLSDDGYR
jgi:simple sugar transport system substrate-binding protein